MFWTVVISVVVLLVVVLLWRAWRSRRTTHEYLSGYAVNVQYHYPWVERLEHCVTMQDSNGYSATHTEFEYRPHQEMWIMELNTEKYVRISREAFEECVRMWGGEGHEIYPEHPNRISGGGGRLYLWNEVMEDSVTHTYLGEYVNYLRNSKPLVARAEIEAERAQSLGLVDYPAIDERYLESDVVLLSPKLSGRIDISPRAQRSIQLLNGHYGDRHQIHIFVLLFDANDTEAIAEQQRIYWQGGNKNEFVLCLGVDAECDEPLVRWCRTFSWSADDALGLATEQWFAEHTKFSIEEFAEWLRPNLDLWRRRQFREFEPRLCRLSKWSKRG